MRAECAGRTAAAASEIEGKYCWRFRAASGVRQFDDAVLGPCSARVADELGDFVVAQRDGTPAYQLAVVVDDHAMGITEVVRGDDLVPSTFRQLELYDLFGWQPPGFAHVPLVVGPDGRRLAKRHGDTRLLALREAGVRPERLSACWPTRAVCAIRPSRSRPESCWPISLGRACRGNRWYSTDAMWRSLL